MVYRPTVRYDDVYNTYVEDLFRATTLDRNQIMRLGLFLLGHTEEGQTILETHAKTSLPSPPWSMEDHGLWMAQTWMQLEKVGTSEKDVTRTKEEGRHEEQRQQREIHKGRDVRVNNVQGIKLFLGQSGIQTGK